MIKRTIILMTTNRPWLLPKALQAIILIAFSHSLSSASSLLAASSGRHREHEQEVHAEAAGDVVVEMEEKQQHDAKRIPSSTITPTHGHMRFLAIGDWGGKDTYPFYTEEQWETAAGMARVASAYSAAAANTGDILVTDHYKHRPAASFVLSLGDNFYSRGFHEEETTPEAYLRFEETYDNVYNRSMMDLPWFVIGGNHDHCGDITMQMKLSEKSDRWNYPDYNHRIVREFYAEGDKNDDSKKLVKLEVIMIDTVLLAGETTCPKAEHGVGTIYPSEYFQYLPHEDVEKLARAENTLEWIENALIQSDADYLIVAGHYPIYSACSHGGNAVLQSKLDPLLRKYGVTAYLSGHEHCLFHFSYKSMDYILSGAGHDCCYAANKIKSLPKSGEMKYLVADSTEYSGSTGVRGGFVSFDTGRDEMAFAIHRENGDVLYESVLLPRASRFRRGKDDGHDVAVEVE